MRSTFSSANPSWTDRLQSTMPLSPGDAAPGFTARDASGTESTLTDLRGRWVLLFFYPRDDTHGCTIEARRLNDNLVQFEEVGATVVGISSQGSESHQKFQQKYGLRFSLVADTERAIGDAYGVPKMRLAGKTSTRMSFLIDPEGRIAHVWPKVSPALHAEEVLARIRAQLTD